MSWYKVNINYSKNYRDIQKDISENIKWLSIVLISYLIISQFILFNGNIPSSSMVETLQVNDRVLASRIAYVGNQPKRGDIGGH